MSEKCVSIKFSEESDDTACKVPTSSFLIDSFDASNSPLLFGCRTGICGTCAIVVESDEPLPEPTDVEKEFFQSLGIVVTSGLRLACQMKVEQSIRIKRIKV